MRSKLFGAVILVAMLALILGAAGPAFAGTSDKIIKDASDGTIDGAYTETQIQDALTYLQNTPLEVQYSDTEGVLEDYLASLQAPGAEGGSLAFTGGEVTLALLVGAGLIAGGLLLRRRSPA